MKTFKAVQQLSWWRVLLALWQLSPVDMNTDCCSDCAYQTVMTTSHSNNSKFNSQQLSIPVIETQSTYLKVMNKDILFNKTASSNHQQPCKQYEQKVARHITAHSFIYIVWTGKVNSTIACWSLNILSGISKYAQVTCFIMQRKSTWCNFLASSTATFRLSITITKHPQPSKAINFCVIPASQTQITNWKEYLAIKKNKSYSKQAIRFFYMTFTRLYTCIMLLLMHSSLLHLLPTKARLLAHTYSAARPYVALKWRAHCTYQFWCGYKNKEAVPREGWRWEVNLKCWQGTVGRCGIMLTLVCTQCFENEEEKKKKKLPQYVPGAAH